MIYVLCIYYTGNGAPCTQRGLHFLYSLDWNLIILSLQHFFFVFNKCGNDILMLQHARKNRLSDLHSSMKVGTNLHLCLQSKIGIFKSFGNRGRGGRGEAGEGGGGGATRARREGEKRRRRR